MKKTIVILIFLCLLLSLGVSCSNEKYPEGTIAVIGDYTITKVDIEKEIISREITDLMLEKIRELNSLPDKNVRENYLQILNLKEEDLSEEQEQFIQFYERKYNYAITKKEAFNVVLREKVLYKVAIEKGYKKFSEDEVLEKVKLANKISRKFMGKDAEKLEKEFSSYENEVVKKYGFNSYEEYEKSRLDKLAELNTINALQVNFIDQINKKIENIPQSDKVFYELNSWENYTEYLLRNEEINILDDDYNIVYYGSNWENEDLDLKVN